MRKYDAVIGEEILAVVSTYVPRHCGIGTFSKDLVESVRKCGRPHAEPMVVALSHFRREYNYPEEVKYEICHEEKHDYIAAAEFINRSRASVVSLQHEYGIFGGPDGNYILDFLGALRKPFVVSLHTVLKKPSKGQLCTLKSICELATKVVILSKAAKETLESVYDVTSDKIIHIPHGAPDLPFSDPAFYQETLGLTGKHVLMTFGHIGPSKGIEMALEAIAKLADEYPNLVYLIVGATHPELLKHQGESYRESLEKMVKDLNIEDRVIFVNKYLSDTELKEYIQTADIYLSPYPGAEQISSGPLTYAVAAGKAVISTPYVAASELLSEGRGILTPFHDPEALAQNIRNLLSDPVFKVRMRKAAYRFGRGLTWQNIGIAYRRLASDILTGKTRINTKKEIVRSSLPITVWKHLESITDDTGILQHAKDVIADRNHGYCTDDNARGLILACKLLDTDFERSMSLIHKTLAFMKHAYNPDTMRMRNFMTYNRNWSEKSGSDDCQGRSVWALGIACSKLPENAGKFVAFELFQNLLEGLPKLSSPRAWAFGILGLTEYLETFAGDVKARSIAVELANKIMSLYEETRARHWKWFENIVAYDNARLPEALLAISKLTDDPAYMQVGLESLEWLFENCTDKQNGHIVLIGNRGWLVKGKDRTRFDQQPVCATALVAASKKAFELTKDSKWLRKMDLSFDWFLGKNDCGLSLVNEETGGCYDGLTPVGVNLNMGAESTLSWLMALCDYTSVHSGVEDQTDVFTKQAVVPVSS